MRALDLDRAEARIASAPAQYASLIRNPDPRFAVIRGASSVKQAEAYLPSNYALMESFEVESFGKVRLLVIIGGYDHAGWTLDGYVIPRLASGLIGCEEISA